MTDRGQTRRLVIVAATLNLLFGLLAARLLYLHRALAASESLTVSAPHTRLVKILGVRGRVFDCHGAQNLLAASLPRKDIWIDPSNIVARGQALLVSARLAEHLNLDRATVMRKCLDSASRYARLAPRVPDNVARQLVALNLPGVYYENAFERSYPLGNSLCHVLGFVNDMGVGSAGIEQRYDAQLNGRPGEMEVVLDGQDGINGHDGELYERRQRLMEPQNGADIYLTLDQNIQYAVEQIAAQAAARCSAKGLWIAVQRVRTGELLALASHPAYDPNDFRHATPNETSNRVTGVTYEPGSTMKAATISAAINERLVTPSTVFDCEGGHWFYAGFVLRDFHPYGNLAVADIVKKSSNIGTAKIALLLGEQGLERYLRAFGFGSRTGLELPGEEAGILHPVSQWSKLSTTRIAIGQGVAVTALQMLGLYCAIANDGFLMRPYLVKRIVRSDGTVVQENRPEVVGRPISGETAATMRTLLSRVTEEGGTGHKAALEGYRVAGKTGTAQKPGRGGYSEANYVASFVGFLPADNPEVGIIVVVDEPQPVHLGGAVAAPIFHDVAVELVRYLEIPPQNYQMAGM